MSKKISGGSGYIIKTNVNTDRIKGVPHLKRENEHILKKGNTITVEFRNKFGITEEIFLKEGDIFFEENGFYIMRKKNKKLKTIFNYKIKKDVVSIITHADRASFEREENEE